MKKTNKYFIALITAVVAIIVWKAIPPSKKINDTPPAQKSTLSQRSERADKKNHTQKSQPNNPKWESLTDDRIDTQARVALARQIDNHMTASEIDLLFQALRHKP